VHGKIHGMSEQPMNNPEPPASQPEDGAAETAPRKQPKEIGGRDGPEPVRYGDWEKNGRCIDF
jgi:hypothetical protein